MEDIGTLYLDDGIVTCPGDRCYRSFGKWAVDRVSTNRVVRATVLSKRTALLLIRFRWSWYEPPDPEGFDESPELKGISGEEAPRPAASWPVSRWWRG